jgi:hypothetical protein
MMGFGEARLCWEIRARKSALKAFCLRVKLLVGKGVFIPDEGVIPLTGGFSDSRSAALTMIFCPQGLNSTGNA